MKRFEFLPLILIVLASTPALFGAENWKSRSDSTSPAPPPAAQPAVSTQPAAKPDDSTAAPTGEAPQVQPGPPEGSPPPIKGPWELPVENDKSVKISKIYDFINDPKRTPIGKDQQLEFEFKYFNHGAITQEEKLKREGHYFTVSWTNDGPPADFVLRFDYRQANTKELVNTLEIPYAHTSGDQKGTFSVTGEPFHKNGFISSWRIALVRNGTIIAQRKSFIW